VNVGILLIGSISEVILSAIVSHRLPNEDAAVLNFHQKA